MLTNLHEGLLELLLVTKVSLALQSLQVYCNALQKTSEECLVNYRLFFEGSSRIEVTSLCLLLIVWNTMLVFVKYFDIVRSEGKLFSHAVDQHV